MTKAFKIVPYKTVHSRIMNYRNFEEYEMLMRLNPHSLDNQFGHTVTILDDVPICFLLVSVINPKTCEIHFFPSVHLNSLFCKEIILKFKEYMQKLEAKFSRIQATIECASKVNLKFAEYLGFKKESILKKFGNKGGDYFMCAIIN